MTISSTTVKNSYNGDGSTATFTYTFKIFANSDLQVIIRSALGTETVKTLTTHYTVTGAGSASGGSITFTAGNIPSNTETVVLRRELPQTQAIDYIANDPFPAESHEEGLDRATMAIQELQEELDRSIKISRTNTMTSTEFTVGASARAGKILGFDDNGELVVSQELGTYAGNWTAGETYAARDIVKDTSNNNIYLCNTGHTASGTTPISSNADVAKWNLLVDATSATASATAAASSATAAASSATAAASSATSASSSATSAASSLASVETLYDNFDDRYLGTKTSDPTLDNDGNALTEGAIYYNSTSNEVKFYNGSSWDAPATDAATSATSAASSASSASTSASNASTSASTATTQAGIATTKAGEASTSATNAASSASAASTSASNAASSASSASTSASTATTQASNAASSATSAASSATAAQTAQAAAELALDNFDDTYLGAKASDPSLDNDGDALTAGDLYFNTTTNQVKYYDGSSWVGIGVNTDITVKVSANDTTAGYLNGKLIAGSGISFTENNDGSNETLTIASALTYPTISSIAPDTITNNATSIVITGTNFVITPNVEIISTTGAITYPNSVTRDSATQLTINVTLPTDGTYFIRVENPDGLAVRSSTALLTVSDAPTWTTSAGSIGSIASGSTVNLSVSGSSDSAVTYSEVTSVLTSNTDTPNSTMNLSLNSSTGAITGTAPSPTAEKVYNFTLRLTDAESQTTDRAFSITISTGINNGGQFN